MTKGLAISLALNAVLAAALVLHWRVPAPTPASLPVAAAPSAAIPRPARSVTPVRIGGDWRNWIEPLRSASVPTDVLAGLVQSDFDRRWQARQSALQESYHRGEIDADALAAGGFEHDAQLERELQAALGPDSYREWDKRRVLQGLNIQQVDLSETEGNQIYDLERALRDDLRQTELDKLKGAIDQATFTARQQNLQEAVAQKLRLLLGEQRASQLQGADDTLGGLKRALSDMPLTSGQLEALADTQRNWERRRSDLVTLQVNTQDPALDEEIRANDEKWRADFERIAGAGAYDRYLKSRDSRYVELRRNADRWGIASADVDHVFAAIRNFEDSVQEYSRDAGARGVDAGTRDAAIRHFEVEAEQSLATRLGGSAYDNLKRNGIGVVASP